MMHENLPPLSGATVLFNGKDLSNWSGKSGQPAAWSVAEGAMTVVRGAGDIFTRERYDDFFLHLEFRCPDMPQARGQAKGNSGVYLQGRYEIQVLDSYGLGRPGKGDCGAVYDQFAPLVNACRPPGEWQAYDVVFRAARVDEAGRVLETARITLFHNGQVVHNNVQVLGPTGGALDLNVGEPGPLRLQDHGDPVSYRNVWAVPLPAAGSDRYEPG